MSLPILHFDMETRSVLDVGEVGPNAYARHPSTEMIAAAWSIQRGNFRSKIKSWNKTQGKFRPPIEGKFIIFAHNSAFERSMWNYNLAPRGLVELQPLELFRCSAARAAMLGLPNSLGELAIALGLKNQKDKEGNVLMRQMATPANYLDEPNLFGEVGPIWRENKTDFERLTEYCEQDVAVESEADQIMGPMPESELAIWLLDQKINQRGITIDRKLCERGIEITSALMGDRGKSLSNLTDGYVIKATQIERIKDWLRIKGVFTPDGLGADALDNLLESDLPGDEKEVRRIRQVLEIRRDTAKSSTAKFGRMLERSADDGRMRDNLRYHGAFTGRWGGSGAQIQNYPRGKVKDDRTNNYLAKLFHDGDVDGIRLYYGDPVDAAKSMLRGCLVAEPGKVLLVWDFGQVEARGLPWLAGEEWKLKAFREMDADPSLPDMYERSYANLSMLIHAKSTTTNGKSAKFVT